MTRLLWRIWPGVCFASVSPLHVQEIPRQALPSSQWVRVRNHLAGVCGSDLQLISGDGDFRTAPAAIPSHRHSYIGHEVVGEVIEIGSDVKQLRVGDRVVLQYGNNCLSAGISSPCSFCLAGNYHLCSHGGIFPDPQPIGGGWSEEMLLHEQQLFPVPLLTDKQAVMLEPSAVAVHAVLRHLPQPGDRVLIIGAGAMGLLIMQVVQALAPQAQISVQARHAFQVEQATRLGASHIIYPQDSYHSVKQATDGTLYRGPLGNQMLLGGFDVIYDTIGSDGTLHDALRWARAQGTVVLVGVHLHRMHLDLTSVWYQEVNLLGAVGHGLETWPIGSDTQRSSFQIADELMAHGLIHPEHLITHRFALQDYRRALKTAANKVHSRAIKVLFDFSLQPPSVVTTVRAPARKLDRSVQAEENFLEEPQNEEPLTEELLTGAPLAAYASARQALQRDISEFIESVAHPLVASPNTFAGPIDQTNNENNLRNSNDTKQADDLDNENAVTITAIMAIDLTPKEEEDQSIEDEALLMGDTEQVARITTAEMVQMQTQLSKIPTTRLEAPGETTYTNDGLSTEVRDEPLSPDGAVPGIVVITPAQAVVSSENGLCSDAETNTMQTDVEEQADIQQAEGEDAKGPDLMVEAELDSTEQDTEEDMEAEEVALSIEEDELDSEVNAERSDVDKLVKENEKRDSGRRKKTRRRRARSVSL